MRLLVCGSRDWTDWQYLYGWLDRLALSNRIDVVIHGAARGADYGADTWAKLRGIPVQPYPALWKAYSSNEKWRAGPDRNQRMLDNGKPDFVVAFKHDFNWRLDKGGTEDMVRRAKFANVPTLVLP